MDSPGRSMEAAELDESAVTAASRSYELANGPVFTPLATPAHRASHAILSSSRLPPRTFPGFEGFDAPPKHDSGRAAPFHPAGGGGSSGSSSRGGSLEEKLRRDHDFASSQREAEARIRFELERSKESLIEGYQRGEERLAAELLHCKEGCDALLREKDDQLARMEARLVEGREGAKVEAEANRRRVQEREQALLVQVRYIYI
ncbi:hypothetical protein B484DRAFT_74533 [Ochromonadaceae sp. CCMP2298]|nr:hypothetical protein B484DRAFT_74533 [Ochromonadaceae sp. CCMP2298]